MRRTACLAARVVGLDIAGIDLVAEDISKPLAEQGGAIVEVNAGPGLLMHLKPAVGKPRPVGQAIVDHLFPDGDNGRIPVVGITGSRDTNAVARSSPACCISMAGTRGLACGDGLFLDQRRVQGRRLPPLGSRPAPADEPHRRGRGDRERPARSSAKAWPTTAARSASSPAIDMPR